MKSKTFTFKGENAKEIFTYSWLPDGKAKAAVQIAHGMAEHAARYERFAKALTDAGFAVYANDHRGHGKTAGALENVGYFADRDGWNVVIRDMHGLTEVIKKDQPGLPVFLFGHSMGSLLSRGYITRWGGDIKGVILSGTGGDPGLLGKVGLLVARWECKRKGRKASSPLMTRLSFGEFNKPFKPARTEFEWLSRDPKEVDKYVADPYCGGVFTAGFWYDMLSSMGEIFRPGTIAKIPKKLPIYLFSGEKDPVGNKMKGVKEAYNAYERAGIADVTVKFYKDGRHEMLNEINRDEVYKDVIAWLNKHL
jgi:alpha-beta hydrolase superfamily lysophospholipase